MAKKGREYKMNEALATKADKEEVKEVKDEVKEVKEEIKTEVENLKKQVDELKSASKERGWWGFFFGY